MAVKANAKVNKPKKSDKDGAFYKVLEGMDGNPQTPAEFDAQPNIDGHFFFNPAEDASEIEKNRCLILNYIHCRLRTKMARTIPAECAIEDDTYEVLHYEEFEGKELQVCVHFPIKDGDSGKEKCFAVIRITPKDTGEFGGANGAVREYDTPNGGMVDDVITALNRRWMPRWKYVVKTLRARMMYDFDKHGIEREVEPQSEGEDKSANACHYFSKVVENTYAVFGGSIGQIVGPKGAKIKEIKDATSVIAIDIPPKVQDGPKPKARDLVLVTIKGTQDKINKAKTMIQAIVDEWAHQPRQPRQAFAYAGHDAPVMQPTAIGGDWEKAGNAVVESTGDWEVGFSGDTAALNANWGGHPSVNGW